MGCIVTVDALHTQKEFAQEIRWRGAEYVLGVRYYIGSLPVEAVRGHCSNENSCHWILSAAF
jgi:predicted transposase YbfD/YdcC